MALPIKWLASNVILVLVALPGGVQLASAVKRRLGGDAASSSDDSSLLAKQSWAARLGVLAVLISIPLDAVIPVVVLWIIPARLTFLYLLFFFV